MADRPLTPKEAQAVELFHRVHKRLLNGPDPQLALKAYETVTIFLVCLEELQNMQAEKGDAARTVTPLDLGHMR